MEVSGSGGRIVVAQGRNCSAVPRENLLGCVAELAVGSWAERTRHLVPGADHVLGISPGSAKRGEITL